MTYKRYFGFIMKGVVLLTILTFFSINAYSNSSLQLDKTLFAPGEDIAVHFSVGDRVAQNAWIGIIPSRIPHGSEAENDKYDITYQYLEGKQSGTLIFKAPSERGNYDFRMNDSDNNGKEIASVSFQVGGSIGTVSLDKTIFGAGEEITVHFTAGPGFAENAWIGIIPSSIPHGSEAENDNNDIAYQYLKGQQNGTLIFKAPTQAGSYDFRMNDTDNNGKEIASVSFQVGGTSGSLSLDKTVFGINEEIAVHFTAGPGFADNAWIGIIPSSAPHGSEAENDKYDIAYQYLKGQQSGTLIFKAPSQAGAYDFRMHDTDNNGKEIASVSFQVSQ